MLAPMFSIPPLNILYLTIFHSTDHFFQLFRPTRLISIESQPKKIIVVVAVVIGVVVHVVVDPRILPLKFSVFAFFVVVPREALWNRMGVPVPRSHSVLVSQ